MKSIEQLSEEWLRLDKDPETRHEIVQLLASKNDRELERRLRNRIAFGTAGLRSRMQAGFARMNSLTVIQASQGLGDYLLEQSPDARQRGVIIGRDARHNSEKFAELAAAAFVAKGIKVWWLERIVHTPLVPFAVRKLNAAAGIMITASHNPAQDNGYKVYWSNGCQIIPPHDTGIAAAIAGNQEPPSWDIEMVKRGHKLLEHTLDRLENDYFATVKHLVQFDSSEPVPYFVYTPMHGVGLHYMLEALKQVLSQPPHDSPPHLKYISPCTVVAEQADPDPDFPTVQFPNPEETGALALAIRTADTHSITLILATDPDADRLAVAEKLPNGAWHQFTGNQLGVLLASSVLESPKWVGGEDRKKLAMLCSTVSTGMLRQIAAFEGFHFVETLTGFKWLGNVAQRLTTADDYHVPFAFEEALGYMFTDVVHDKDGITAAAVFLAAAAKWMKESSMTPYQKLQQLYQKYGYFAEANTYLVSASLELTSAVFNNIRRSGPAPESHPTHLCSRKILRWRDLTTGFDTATPDNVPALPVDRNSQMITCEVEGGTRFTVRGSGTEPKIKLYIESRADTEEEAKTMALTVQKELLEEWFGLFKP